MKSNFIIILLAFLCCFATSFAQNSKVGDVRRQKQQAQEEIERTSSQINDNSRKIKRSLNDLQSIEADIKKQEKEIKSLQSQINVIENDIKALNDSIDTKTKKLESLRESYAHAIRKMQFHSSSFDRLIFLFSSNSLHEAYRRMRYLKQFSKWRESHSNEIQAEADMLKQQKAKLDEMKSQKSQNLAQLQRAKLDLEGKKSQQSAVVNDLRKQDKMLRSILAEQQRKADALDRELDRLIAEEERRAAERRAAEERRRREQLERERQKDSLNEEPQPPVKREPSTPEPGYAMSEPERKLAGSFESNKGQLLFPVQGNYKIVQSFGKHRHPQLKYVQVNNNGIDIEAVPGAVARAIFDGKVSAVFPQDGYNTVVMVRHGKYLSIYVNLSDIYVHTGEEIKAGQPIGKIYSDPEDGNRTILHFEVRKEREKLDPEQWVK